MPTILLIFRKVNSQQLSTISKDDELRNKKLAGMCRPENASSCTSLVIKFIPEPPLAELVVANAIFVYACVG